jgi:outer membrane murein-binding lipoprotein Lpp
MNRTVVIAISLASFAAIGLLVLWAGAPDEAALESSRTEVTRLASELEALKREGQATRELAQRAAETGRQALTSNPRPPPEATGPIPERSREDPPAPPPQAPSFEESFADLESRFAAQERDEAWSRSASEQVAQKLSTALPEGSRFLSADCRASICRAEVAHVDVEAHRAYLRSSFMAPESWDGPVLAVLEESSGQGGAVTVAYIGKKDTNLFPALMGAQ